MLFDDQVDGSRRSVGVGVEGLESEGLVGTGGVWLDAVLVAGFGGVGDDGVGGRGFDDHRPRFLVGQSAGVGDGIGEGVGSGGGGINGSAGGNARGERGVIVFGIGRGRAGVSEDAVLGDGERVIAEQSDGGRGVLGGNGEADDGDWDKTID